MDSQQEREGLVRRIQEVFFLSALASYTGGGQKTVIAELPGRRVVICEGTGEYEGFRVVDMWSVNEETLESFGTKEISCEGQPVWFMFYEGRYDKDSISFLKEVLIDTYGVKEFCGGRGRSKEDKTRRLRYMNDWRGNFNSFSGSEIIARTGSDCVIFGHHNYQGRLLI